MRNFIVTIEGKQYQVGVEEVGGSPALTAVSEAKTEAPAAAPAAVHENRPQNNSNNANGTKIKSPMPGMIKSLSKPEGSAVKKGDVILVLEAMKMDNDITAPCDGTVSYKVTSGSNVDTGTLMAVIG